jgi:hypothetical protein
MNYTKEMQEANIPPEVGMKFICNDDSDSSRIKEFKGIDVEVIGVCSCRGRITVTFEHKSLGIGCGFFDSCWVKPIDTRTDTEKAVDDLKGIYTKWLLQPNGSYSNLIVEQIKAGKITGVKWVGND